VIFFFFFFEIGSHKLFAQGWLQTKILLISARITGVSYQHLAGAWHFAQVSLEQKSSYFTFPAIAEIIGVYHHAQLFSIETGSHKFV
jgi:hypothetical protein